MSFKPKSNKSVFRTRDECQKSIQRSTNQTNHRFRHFRQYMYHAGDHEDLYLYGLLQSVADPPRPIESPDESSEDARYAPYSTESLIKTAHYLMDEVKKGVFVSIRNRKLSTFLPFSNANYANRREIVERLQMDMDIPNRKLLEKMTLTKEAAKKHLQKKPELLNQFDDLNIQSYFFTPKVAPENSDLRNALVDAVVSSLVPPSRWFTNNCLVSREKIHEWRSPEGDKNVALYFDMFSQLCETCVVPDCDFFLNMKDFPVVKSIVKGETQRESVRHHPYDALYDEKTPHPLVESDNLAPVLSRSSKSNFDDILIPTEDEWRTVTSSSFVEYVNHKLTCTHQNTNGKTKEAIGKIRLVPLKDRNKVVVFRGSATGCGSSAETNIRFRAQKFAHETHILERSNIELDIGLTDANARLKRHTKTGLDVADATSFTPATRIEKIDQYKNKYILHLPGHVAAFRLADELMSGSLVLVTPLNEETPYKVSFWNDLRIDAKDGSGHVVQVNSDLSDLDETLKWYEDNPTLAQKVVDNARDFAMRRFASKHAVLDRLRRVVVSVARARIPETKSHDTVHHVHIIVIGERTPLAHKKRHNKRNEKVLTTFMKIIRSFGVNRVTMTYFDPVDWSGDASNQTTLVKVASQALDTHTSISRFVVVTCDTLPSWSCARLLTQKSSCSDGPLGWSTLTHDGIVLAALDRKHMRALDKGLKLTFTNKSMRNALDHDKIPIVFKINSSYDDTHILRLRKNDLLWKHYTQDTSDPLNLARLVFDNLDEYVANGNSDPLDPNMLASMVLQEETNLNKTHEPLLIHFARLAIRTMFERKSNSRSRGHTIEYIVGKTSFEHLVRHNLDADALQGKIATPGYISEKVWGTLFNKGWPRGSFDDVTPVQESLYGKNVLETCGGLGIDTFTMYSLGAKVIVYENHKQRCENLRKNANNVVTESSYKHNIKVVCDDWVDALYDNNKSTQKIIHASDIFFLDPPWVVREGDGVEPGREILFSNRPFTEVVQKLVQVISAAKNTKARTIVCKLPRTYPYRLLIKAIEHDSPHATFSNPRTEFVVGGILFLVISLPNQSEKKQGGSKSSMQSIVVNPTDVHGFENESMLILGRVKRTETENGTETTIIDVDTGNEYMIQELSHIRPLHPSVVRCTSVFPRSRCITLESGSSPLDCDDVIVFPCETHVQDVRKYVVSSFTKSKLYDSAFPNARNGAEKLNTHQLSRRFHHAIAIITIFRESGDGALPDSRTKQLEKFRLWSRQFINKAARRGIDVDVYIIEQSAYSGFNIGKLKNIGMCIASNTRIYLHFIICDIDATPDKLLERFYLNGPRGDGIVMLANNGSVRYKHAVKYGATSTTPFLGMAIMVTQAQYATIGGFPNSFYSWGGEDVVLACRVAMSGLAIDYPKQGTIIDNEIDTYGNSIDTAKKQKLLEETGKRGFYWEKTIRELKQLKEDSSKIDNGILQCVFDVVREITDLRNRERHIFVDVYENEDKSMYNKWFPNTQTPENAEHVKKEYKHMKNSFTWNLRSI